MLKRRLKKKLGIQRTQARERIFVLDEVIKTSRNFIPSVLFDFAVVVWPVTGQGFQNTNWPAVLYSQ